MILDKPTGPRLSEAPNFDYDIAERLTRALQDSHLIVARTTAVTAFPDDMENERPIDSDDLSLMVDYALVTDCRRGWLVIVDESDDYDAGLHADLVFRELLEGAGPARPHFAVRTAIMYGRPRPTTSIPVWTIEGLRHRVEAEYEHAFAGAPAIDHGRLVDACGSHGWSFLDEHELRRASLETAALLAEPTASPADMLVPDPRSRQGA